MKIVLSLGGRIITKNLTSEHFKKYVDVLKKLKNEGHSLIVVTGGGSVCRTYQKIARELNATKSLLDMVGIYATRLNAATLIACLGEDAYPVVLTSVNDVKRHIDERILICGGGELGHSTDFDTAIIAEATNADLLINATDVDGVYSSDPQKNPNAKKFDNLSYDEFQKIVLEISQEPGEYELFDLAAIQIIRRSKIKTIIIDALTDPVEIIRAVEGTHKGTIIS